jgi:DNA repair exonuclease SbcCD ATPase subunit
MASPAEAKIPNASGKESGEGANVDKIRDILFGSQMRDYEKRFARLEDNVTKAVETLREDMAKRFDTLSGFVQQEVDSLSQRFKTEKSERTDGLKEISRELKDAAKGLEKKLGQLEESFADGQSELRSKILEHSKAVMNEIDKLRREAAAALDSEVEVLRNEKTDRAALADLFAEFSLRLKNDLELPEK